LESNGGEVLGSRVWGEREGTGEGEEELGVGVNTEEVGERERVRFKCCGTQTLKFRLDRSDRLLLSHGLWINSKLITLVKCN